MYSTSAECACAKALTGLDAVYAELPVSERAAMSSSVYAGTAASRAGEFFFSGRVPEGHIIAHNLHSFAKREPGGRCASFPLFDVVIG